MLKISSYNPEGGKYLEDVILKYNERIDDLQCKGLRIIQNLTKFRFGIDAVLLASFSQIRKGDFVIDLGTGTGIIPILLAGKTEAEKIVGLEIQREMAEMAQRSIRLNNLKERISIVEGDLKKVKDIFGTGEFDVVTCNPPYMNYGGGLLNPNDSKAISRHEIACTLNDVIISASKLLKDKGRFNMVHRPERLIGIIHFMRENKLEPKRLQMICPKFNSSPYLLLIEGVKNGRPMLKVLPTVYVYSENGEYTEQIDEMYGRR